MIFFFFFFKNARSLLEPESSVNPIKMSNTHTHTHTHTRVRVPRLSLKASNTTTDEERKGETEKPKYDDLDATALRILKIKGQSSLCKMPMLFSGLVEILHPVLTLNM